MAADFLVRPDELTLQYRTPVAARSLAFDRAGLSYDRWRVQARAKVAELIGAGEPEPCDVAELRRTEYAGVQVTVLVMRVSGELTLPAYLLHPANQQAAPDRAAVLALHGHGQVDECLGLPGVREDYHHDFALALAQAGHTVLLPELRGFGVLYDLAAQRAGAGLTYWRWGTHMPFTLLTDGYQSGRTLLGDTVEDLLRWEDWLALAHGVTGVDVAGISWGGDLACTYPVFSSRVRSIFASGTLGSFEATFAVSGNAPAHCVPGVLRWLDRADIAGLNAPRPLAVHYGELDVPGPDNGSASNNQTVPEAMRQLRAIYAAAGAPDAVTLQVSAGRGHEMDNELLLDFLQTRKG